MIGPAFVLGVGLLMILLFALIVFNGTSARKRHVQKTKLQTLGVDSDRASEMVGSNSVDHFITVKEACRIADEPVVLMGTRMHRTLEFGLTNGPTEHYVGLQNALDCDMRIVTSVDVDGVVVADAGSDAISTASDFQS